jgi:hypothetical protein
MRIAEDVKKFFHRAGIHSTTIQPEFVQVSSPYQNAIDRLVDTSR